MKTFYRALLGGLILFFYQFLSFAGANFHGNAQAYTEKQDTIMAFLIYLCTVGFVAFLVVPYTNYIWYQTPDIWAHLLDAFVPYAIIGALYARFWRSAA